MTLERFSARNFRCLADVGFEPDSRYNLIIGPNASGKTSILEALGYLGRGKSFRGAGTSNLIRHGEQEFVLFAEVSGNGRVRKVGVKNSREGLEVRVDGDSRGGAGALAEALPLQVIDPDVHNLVAGSPDERRRYLDWLAFHVEHGYLETWRRFRRALKQRNAALRAGAGAIAIHGWNAEFCAQAALMHQGREKALRLVKPALTEMGLALLGGNLDVDYRQGWSAETELMDALKGGLERDRQLGSTQSGPHRADLGLSFDSRLARKLVSRGQQKLLACALILAATATVQDALGRRLLLLLDDPAAELDRESLDRLVQGVVALDCQVIATSLSRQEGIFGESVAVFHVEHGSLSRLV